MKSKPYIRRLHQLNSNSALQAITKQAFCTTVVTHQKLLEKLVKLLHIAFNRQVIATSTLRKHVERQHQHLKQTKPCQMVGKEVNNNIS